MAFYMPLVNVSHSLLFSHFGHSCLHGSSGGTLVKVTGAPLVLGKLLGLGIFEDITESLDSGNSLGASVGVNTLIQNDLEDNLANCRSDIYDSHIPHHFNVRGQSVFADATIGLHLLGALHCTLSSSHRSFMFTHLSLQPLAEGASGLGDRESVSCSNGVEDLFAVAKLDELLGLGLPLSLRSLLATIDPFLNAIAQHEGQTNDTATLQLGHFGSINLGLLGISRHGLRHDLQTANVRFKGIGAEEHGKDQGGIDRFRADFGLVARKGLLAALVVCGT
mmetsp:Transcript_9160/g.25773  ORF Transcript_9160/g.25773 Transcript_9160/m.25773 type:complete len:278 (-) Transcript_9160:554-1387(-)